MPRQEFTAKTKLAAWNRCGGHCECGCGQKILGRPEYDHKLPCALGGDNSLENCVVMSAKCHRIKTTADDTPLITKANSVRKSHAGIKSKSRPMPGTKASGWKKPMNAPAHRREE